MGDVFTISEKLVKERDGANYALEKYKEGTDYVRRRNRFGFKVVFRKGFLGEVADVVDPSLVEHKQQKEEVQPETGSKTVVPVKAPECDRTPVVAKITRRYPNPRFVDTDVCGRVFCGEKGRNLKTGQLILVSGGTIVLGKAGMIATAAL
jgi:hypothetical protein